MKARLRRAAQIMLLGDRVMGCCHALSVAAGCDEIGWLGATAVHRKMFRCDSPYERCSFWMSGSPQYNGTTEDRDRRVYSLLLAAEAWEDFV